MLSKKLTSYLALAFILILLTAFFVSPKDGFSPYENRYLEKLPSFTLKSFASGDFTGKLTSYISDHFFMRSSWISLNTLYSVSTLKDEVNGAYFCSDGSLIEKYVPMERPDLIYRSINAFCEANPGADVKVMLVPTAVTVNGNDLPSLLPRQAQTADMKIIAGCLSCTFIDVQTALNASEKPFYSYDHHWTTEGAYAAYREYCRVSGLEPVPENALVKEVLTTEFRGTIYNKTVPFNAGGDTIEYWHLPDESYTVTWSDTVTHDVIDRGMLDTNDKYGCFFSGNHPLVTVHNDELDNGEKLLLIKDSYANCFAPFLMSHYETVVMVDPRYYGLSVHDLMEEQGIDRVLFLYNLNTIGTDIGIRGIE